jgi:hypothetical protein
LVALNDEPLAIAITQIFNDACADRMKASSGRINGMGTLPYWDKDIMNKEMRRIVDLGVKGIVLPDRPGAAVAGLYRHRRQGVALLGRGVSDLQ